MQWVLTVTDAGPNALRFITMNPSDGQPGCEATTANPRDYIQTSGVLTYTPHSSGVTTFTFDPKKYNCGRVQVDVSIVDSTGRETLILGMMVNYGTVCAPQPQPVVCVPPSQAGVGGVPVPFSATGGSSPYTWSAPTGTPSTGSGTTFSSTFPSSSTTTTHSVTVTSGGVTSTCTVTIPGVITGELVCIPPTQGATIGQVVTIGATGVAGPYTWSAPTGSPASGAGASFNTSYATAGTKTVTVTASGQTKTCTVVVTEAPTTLVCAPPTQTVGIGAPAAMTATGGTGTYSWSAPGGVTPSGTGAAFSTSYATAGTRTVTVTSGTQTASCTVIVPEIPPLVCAPPTQTVSIGAPAAMSATGGTGTYSWSAPGGSTPAGTGAAFSTSYATAGTRTVTVTSGTQTASCTVIVPEIPPLVCAPPSQLVGIGSPATMTATGGTGTYSWSAPGGTTASGTGPSFTTSYTTAGTNTVTVTSGSQTATCIVTTGTPVCPPPGGPTFTVRFPVFSNISGDATVSGPGVWKLTMYASLTEAGYTNDMPDSIKGEDVLTLTCPDPFTAVSGTLSVNYSWAGHPYTHWWITLELNGTRVFKSAEAIKPPGE
jgi:hypothetical protein